MKNTDFLESRQLVKVTTDKLEMGMYIAKLDRPWLDSPFLFQGFPLERTEDLDKLKSLCDFVFVDMVKTRSMERRVSSETVNDIINREKTDYQEAAPVEDEVAEARHTYDHALSHIESMLREAATRGEVNARLIKRHVKACVESVVRNPNALIWLSHIKHVDNYTAEHSLHVGILAIALGRQLGLPRRYLETLGLCGMLHDVGKTRVDRRILLKPGKLTREEFEEMKRHPGYGRELLQHDPLMPAEVLEATYSHHERIDGSGYPDGVDASMLSFYTRIISIADSYDAMTSTRIYARSRTSTAALKTLYEQRGSHFDQDLVVKFIECVGLYPPGCIVEMTSGEVGIVIAADQSHRLYPRVALVLDDQKNPVPNHTIVDLRKLDPVGKRSYHIKQVLEDGTYGVRIDEFTREHTRVSM